MGKKVHKVVVCIVARHCCNLPDLCLQAESCKAWVFGSIFGVRDIPAQEPARVELHACSEHSTMHMFHNF